MEAEFLDTLKKWAADFRQTIGDNPELQEEVVQGKDLAKQITERVIGDIDAGATLLLLGNSFGMILTDLVENNEEALEDEAVKARALYANQLGATFVIAADELLNKENNDEE